VLSDEDAAKQAKTNDVGNLRKVINQGENTKPKNSSRKTSNCAKISSYDSKTQLQFMKNLMRFYFL
jgi:hypothetical protein